MGPALSRGHTTPGRKAGRRARPRRHQRTAVAAVAAFAVGLFVFRATGGDAPTTADLPDVHGAPAGAPAGADSGEAVITLERAVTESPEDAEARAQLGLAYLQQVREGADASLYGAAEDQFEAALELDPENFNATSGLGALALSRHDFRSGLEFGLRAREINPTIAVNYGVIADAQIELGRYGAAERTLQRWIDLRPGLSSYARVSYFRELNGDLSGALRAMRFAISAGGDRVENSSYVRTLAGKLHFVRGDYVAAARSYRTVLAAAPDYGPAIAGLAAVQAANGRLHAAASGYRKAQRQVGVAENLIGLGEVLEAAGRDLAAERAYRGYLAAEADQRANGVDPAAELAIFNADHGSAGDALRFGRHAWRVAPSIRGADAYAWALHRAGRDRDALRYSRRATALGSPEPMLLYRAGMVARSAGREGRARELLGGLLDQSPRFNPLFAPRAREALRDLQ